MKLRILKNVVIGTKIAKVGEIVDVDRRIAGVVVDGGYASEDLEPTRQQQQQSQRPINKEQMLRDCKAMPPGELQKLKADAEAALAKDPHHLEAKAVLEVINEVTGQPK